MTGDAGAVGADATAGYEPATEGPPPPGTPVLVAGLGVSGAAAARALLRSGCTVRAVDSAETDALAERAAGLADAGAETRLGGDADPTAAVTDEPRPALVVTSPGIPESSPLLTAAREAGLDVWGEPELAWRLSGGRTRLVGVTGTNGKTTTTELLAVCLGAPSAGNIGTPLVEVLSGETPPPLVVAELSSFQLRFCHAFRTDVGVLCNVAADHLDWHGGADAYRAAKARVWGRHRPGDTAVLNADDPGAEATRSAYPPAGRVFTFTRSEPGPGQAGVSHGWLAWRGPDGALVRILPADELGAPGPHNLANALAAVAAAVAVGVDPAPLRRPLRDFTSGAHRLERVATVNGVRYVNDSKATNPHAAAAALASFTEPVVWIAGGLNKGLDFAELAAASGGVRAACTVGRSGAELATLTRGLGIPTVEAGDVATAVAEAARLAEPGDVVLLAPACASMDQFADYAARGQAFRDAVAALPSASTGEPARGD